MIKKINALLLLFLVVPMLFLSGCAGVGDETYLAQKLIEENVNKYSNLEATGTLKDGIRTIEISGSQFFFSPELIVVNKGEKIRLIISADDVPHGFEIEGFMIPDYDIDTVIRKGTPLVLEFEANEVGVWEFICTIYCGFGHSIMKGTFVIR